MFKTVQRKSRQTFFQFVANMLNFSCWLAPAPFAELLRNACNLKSEWRLWANMSLLLLPDLTWETTMAGSCSITFLVNSFPPRPRQAWCQKSLFPLLDRRWRAAAKNLQVPPASIRLQSPQTETRNQRSSFGWRSSGETNVHNKDSTKRQIPQRCFLRGQQNTDKYICFCCTGDISVSSLLGHDLHFSSSLTPPLSSFFSVFWEPFSDSASSTASWTAWSCSRSSG